MSSWWILQESKNLKSSRNQIPDEFFKESNFLKNSSRIQALDVFKEANSWRIPHESKRLTNSSIKQKTWPWKDQIFVDCPKKSINLPKNQPTLTTFVDPWILPNCICFISLDLNTLYIAKLLMIHVFLRGTRTHTQKLPLSKYFFFCNVV